MAYRKLDEIWFDDSDQKLYRNVGETFQELSPSTGGGEGQINYSKNPLQENSLSYLTYSGFTPSWDTTYNLYGGGALKCSMTSSGTGRYLRIALDDLSDAQVTEMLRLSFFYKLTTGGDTDVSIKLWDGTNYVSLTPYYLVSASGTITKYDGWAYALSATGNYLEIGFADSTAITLYIADVLLQPRVLPQGAVITEWQSYTLDITASTTNPTYGTVVERSGRWRRVGSNAEIQIKYSQSTAGTAGSGTYQFSLPPGLSVDLTKLPNSTLHHVVGVAQIGGGATEDSAFEIGVVIVDSNGKIIIKYYNTSSYFIGSGHYPLSQTYTKYTLNFSVPISGWTSSINLVTEAQEFAFNTQATINTNDTTSFGYGPNGTLILANTAVTYYDVQFKNPVPNSLDKYALEVHSKVDGSWVDIESAFVPSLYAVLGHSMQGYDSANWFWRGAMISKVSANKIRVYFFPGCWGSIDFTDGADVSIKTWAQVVAAADGYDRWRVRKISNGNMAEAPASGIYESGQNANGYYVKYVDGTMEQWGNTNFGSQAITTASGNLYRTSAHVTLSFPQNFADTNYVVHSAGSDGLICAILSFPVKAVGSVQGYLTNSGSGTYTVVLGWYAIGKWNLSRSVAAPGTPVGESTVFTHYLRNGTTTSGIIDFDIPVEDSLSCVTTGASWKFTAPVSGLYQIILTGAPVLYTSCSITLYKNGSSVARLCACSSSHNDYLGGQVHVLRMNSGDYLDLRVSTNQAVFTSSEGDGIQITRLSA